MTRGFVFGLTLISALGSGLIAGVFFAFSAFVMRALVRLPATQGIAAMQSINVAVINPWFMGPFLGTAGACIVLAGAALTNWQRPASPYLLAGSMLYLLGSVLVTMVCNAPRNDVLAVVDAATENSPIVWERFVAGWTVWNHVRAAAALLAAGSLMIGMTKNIF
jgi:uncharacterized membrane protein